MPTLRPTASSVATTAALLLALICSAPATTFAVDGPGDNASNSVNVSPLGIAAGSYAVNFERRVTDSHGLLVEGTFGSSTSGKTSQASVGAALGWRMHFSGKQPGWFIGAMASYGMGSGTGSVDSGKGLQTFDVNTTALTVTGNFGRRWVFGPGINITFRFGLGWGNYSVTTESTDPAAQDVVKLVDDLLTFLPVAVDGELSVGFCF